MAFRVLVLFLLFACSCAHYLKRQPRQAESADDVKFDTPDITVDSPTANLEVFRVNRGTDAAPKWVSIGYPLLIEKDGEIFQFTSEFVGIQIQLLNSLQKELLADQARHQFYNQNITVRNFGLMPLVDFACKDAFRHGEAGYEVKERVFDLKGNPLSLRFPLHRGDPERSAFEKRIENKLVDPLIFECELTATGKREQVNSLTITRADAQRIELSDKLMGPANEVYVSRNQLISLAGEVASRLHIKITDQLSL